MQAETCLSYFNEVIQDGVSKALLVKQNCQTFLWLKNANGKLQKNQVLLTAM